MTCVLSGLGLLALATGSVEARWTRHGYTSALQGDSAHAFGLTILFFGLLPLALVARSRRAAMWIATSAVVLGLVSVFVGPYLLGHALR
jgi:hypothetical protein